MINQKSSYLSAVNSFILFAVEIRIVNRRDGGQLETNKVGAAAHQYQRRKSRLLRLQQARGREFAMYS